MYEVAWETQIQILDCCYMPWDEWGMILRVHIIWMLDQETLCTLVYIARLWNYLENAHRSRSLWMSPRLYSGEDHTADILSCKIRQPFPRSIHDKMRNLRSRARMSLSEQVLPDVEMPEFWKFRHFSSPGFHTTSRLSTCSWQDICEPKVRNISRLQQHHLNDWLEDEFKAWLKK